MLQHIAANTDAPPPHRFYFADDGRRLVLVAGCHHDVCAVLRKPQGNRPPNAAVATGDDRHLTR